jgi:hypothetical protein
MTLHGSAEPVAGNRDFGLAEHLASIEVMHREALAELDALVQPWAHLWASRSEVAAPETAEFHVTGQPPVRGQHAAAA